MKGGSAPLVGDVMTKRQRRNSDDDEPQIGETFFFMPEPDPGSSRGGIGAQALPMLDDITDDFDGNPKNGFEYLWVVNQEAQALDRVSYWDAEFEFPPAAGSGRPQTEPVHVVANDKLTLAKKDFSRRFVHFRKSLDGAAVLDTLHETRPPASEDREAWHRFIYSNDAALLSAKSEALSKLGVSTGRGENFESEGAGPNGTVRRPTPFTVIEQIPFAGKLCLLDHFAAWLGERCDTAEALRSRVPTHKLVPPSVRRKQRLPRPVEAPASGPVPSSLPTEVELSWIFSLLATLDDLVDGNVIAQLRHIARILIRCTVTGPSETLDPARVGCYVLVAAICDVWGQSDLWDELAVSVPPI